MISLWIEKNIYSGHSVGSSKIPLKRKAIYFMILSKIIKRRSLFLSRLTVIRGNLEAVCFTEKIIIAASS